MDIVVITCNPSFIIVELFVFVKDVLDSLEFARGSENSSWGSVRAAMGHPEPFPVKYAAIGNEDCGKKFYNGKLKRSCV
jgi:alpha-N-arabinofuranosidase